MIPVGSTDAGLADEIEPRLAAAGCVAAREEAALLVQHAPDRATLDRWVAARCDGTPLAWLIGWTDVGGVRVAVDPGVYVPRPQTAELARRAAEAMPRGGRLLDLCAGSGAIAAFVAATRPDVTVVAIDVDPVATRCARRNGVPAAVASAEAVPLPTAAVDVVTAVAPYVPSGELPYLPSDVVRHEPLVALDGGVDGLHVVRSVIAAATRVLRPGGWLLLELGGDQDVAVTPDLAAYTDVSTWHDEEGDLRGLAARLPE